MFCQGYFSVLLDEFSCVGRRVFVCWETNVRVLGDDGVFLGESICVFYWKRCVFLVGGYKKKPATITATGST